MFNIFKKKKYLRDCIVDRYVDIHSHTLFGVDDGAKTIEDTEHLLKQMIELGFSKVITTPHTMATIYPNTKEILQNRYQEVLEKLPALTKQLDYQVASEYMIDEAFEARIDDNSLLPLKDSYVLVEMSYINPPIFLEDVLFHLVSKDYIPVLAHPERYNFYYNDIEAYKILKKRGCKFQLNLLSTVGYYGSKVAETAQQLLKMRMYDFVGSDIHHNKHLASFQQPLVVKEEDYLKELIKNNQLFL